MSSRGSISGRQRNSNIKVPVVVIRGRKALLVKIDWTTAPVVKITVRKDCKIGIIAMDIKTWATISVGRVSLEEGQVVHFVRSERAGYYYMVSETAFTEMPCTCTCVSALNQEPCDHHAGVRRFADRHATPKPQQESKPQKLDSASREAVFLRLKARYQTKGVA